MNLKSYLDKPYPYYYSDPKRLVIFLFFVCLSSFCFSYFFEPFELNATEHKIDSIWILFIHAFLPFPIAFIYLSLLSASMKDDTSWTLGKELLHLCILLLIIGVTDFLIRDLIYTNPDNWSLRYFWEEIRNTFLVGGLILLVILPLNLERLIKKHTTDSKKLTIQKGADASKARVLIKSNVAGENFELDVANFLFAKVESNYTEIFTKSIGGSDKKLVRMTLKELEDQLKSFPFVQKTHRSFLVNLHQIKSVGGNAQGYQLLLTNYPTPIPVSRSKIKEFNERYTAM